MNTFREFCNTTSSRFWFLIVIGTSRSEICQKKWKLKFKFRANLNASALEWAAALEPSGGEWSESGARQIASSRTKAQMGRVATLSDVPDSPAALKQWLAPLWFAWAAHDVAICAEVTPEAWVIARLDTAWVLLKPSVGAKEIFATCERRKRLKGRVIRQCFGPFCATLYLHFLLIAGWVCVCDWWLSRKSFRYTYARNQTGLKGVKRKRRFFLTRDYDELAGANTLLDAIYGRKISDSRQATDRPSRLAGPLKLVESGWFWHCANLKRYQQNFGHFESLKLEVCGDLWKMTPLPLSQLWIGSFGTIIMSH